MIEHKDIPAIVRQISLHGIQRVDAALEGDWNQTVVTVWTRYKGKMAFSIVSRSHPTFKSSLELYLENAWLGIHCFNRINGSNVLDEEFFSQVIDYIETNLKLDNLKSGINV